MEWIVSRNLWRVPLLLQVRCKYHSKKPRPKTLERRTLEAITSPIYQHKLFPDDSDKCVVLRTQKIKEDGQNLIIKENQFERFLIKEVQKLLKDSWLIAAVDMDSCIMRRTHEIKRALLDDAIDMIIFPSIVFEKALQDSVYMNLVPAIGGRTCLLFSKEDKVKHLIKTLRKVPELHLLGGVLDNRILTKQGFEDYAKLPDLDRLRGQFLSTTKAQMSTMTSLLQHHQRVLVGRLGRIGAPEEGAKD